MRRVVEHILDIGLLHDAAGVHHRHPVAHPGDYAEVVGDENDGRPGLLLDVLEQPQVLELDGGVQRGSWLVGDQQVGGAGDGDGAHDALAHPAAHLVGEVG